MREGRLQKITIATLLLLTWGADASGYELLTHQRITRTAFDQSVLNKGYLEEELQLSSTGVLRWEEEERDVRGWLAEGSVREDDSLRFLNHFYDPEGDRGLRSLCGVGLRAFDWAFDQPTQPEEFRFSWSDARRLFLTALTDPSPREREAAMARTSRTLGDVVHLVQDMGSPEHTRNDSHAGVGLFGVFPCGAPSLFESEIDRRVNSFDYSGYPPPSFSRFRDFWTTGDGRGFAEFTNRNFVSKGTNFTRTEEGNTGRPSFGVRYPSPRLRLGLREDVDIRALIPGTQLEGQVTFFGNEVDDRLTGERIRNSRMTTYSLFDSELRRRGRSEVFTLNRFNIEAAAKLLLPRATGYSAGLIDYFFRGKLDVDLIQADPNDPSVVRLSGTNASDDKLDGGILTLYADVPAEGPTQGMVRRAAAALDPNDPQLTVTADRDAPIESARFKVPEDAKDAERFVAVYTGRLGNEAPQGEFPGAVIGKVLGGVRVEQVFLDGEQWTLRTPKGVFPLREGDRPLTRADLEEVRWGDGENVLVARTPFGPDQPNRVVAYEIPRQPNSVEVETVLTPEGPALHLRKMSEAAFPFGLALGTTVQYDQIVRYRQQLGRSTITNSYRWEPHFPFGPIHGTYVFDHQEEGSLAIETVHQAVVPFQESFPLVLDLAHNVHFGTAFRPYQWSLEEVAVDASGRLLGLVEVVVGAHGHPPVHLPFFRPLPGEGLEAIAQVPVEPFHIRAIVWALVDLKEGRVVASTAGPAITIASAETREAPPWGRNLPLEIARLRRDYWAGVYVKGFERYVGGPTDHVGESGWAGQDLRRWIEGDLPIRERTALQVQEGVEEISAESLRDELKAEASRLGLFAYEVAREQGIADFKYYCNVTCSVVRVISAQDQIVRAPGELDQARRARPAPGGERLVLRLRQHGGREATDNILVWDPATARAEGRLQGPRFSLFPVGATRAAVLVDSTDPFGWFLFPLEGSAAPRFVPFSPGDPLFFELLDPSFLYSFEDLKFYRPGPPLQRTALPAKLADAPGNPFGDYHAIRLP